MATGESEIGREVLHYCCICHWVDHDWNTLSSSYVNILNGVLKT